MIGGPPSNRWFLYAHYQRIMVEFCGWEAGRGERRRSACSIAWWVVVEAAMRWFATSCYRELRILRFRSLRVAADFRLPSFFRVNWLCIADPSMYYVALALARCPNSRLQGDAAAGAVSKEPFLRAQAS